MRCAAQNPMQGACCVLLSDSQCTVHCLCEQQVATAGWFSCVSAAVSALLMHRLQQSLLHAPAT